MREAFAGLGIEGRIGVNTGEVVTGTEERLATGDAVNVAARLQQAAQPGEVLIGEATLALVGERGRRRAGRAARAEGQARAGSGLPAARRPRGAGAPARRDVRRARARAGAARRGAGGGRRRSSAASWSRSWAMRASASRGSSAEALASIDARGRSRPLPPLRGGDHLLAGRRGGEAARRVAVRSGRRGGDPLAARRDRRRARRRRRSPGRSASCSRSRRRSSSSSTTSSGARRRSSTWSSTSRCSRAAPPLLLVCMARPELLDSRPTWPVTVRLEPLSDAGRGEPDRGSCAGGAAREDRRRGRRQPALHRRDAGDGRGGGRRGRGAADA